ncbi:hypothetical protein EON71_01020, partial [bacterium]
MIYDQAFLNFYGNSPIKKTSQGEIKINKYLISLLDNYLCFKDFNFFVTLDYERFVNYLDYQDSFFFYIFLV